MPFDANGNFSLVPGTIVADGLNILPSQHNPPFQDVANGLSQVVVRDGRAPMTGPLNMNGYKITGVAAGDAPDDVVTNAAIADLGVAIGDGKWSLRDLSPNWLRRDGSLYDISVYPDLAALLPALSDGVIWNNISTGITGTATGILITEDGAFIVTNSGDDATIWKSDDIENNWTAVATISGFQANGLAKLGATYVAYGTTRPGGRYGAVSLSSDGIVWGGLVTIDSPLTNNILGIDFDGTTYVAVGSRGYIANSSDLISWTLQDVVADKILRDIKWLNSTFVVTGDDGTILHSATGLGSSWTQASSGTTEHLRAVTFGEGLYVVVGDNGTIRTSPNLSAWTSRSSGTTASLQDVVYSSAGFMASSNNGVVRISSAGTSWASTVPGVSAPLPSIAVDPAASERYFVITNAGALLEGTRTLPTQFRVPNDGPNEWVRAL